MTKNKKRRSPSIDEVFNKIIFDEDIIRAVMEGQAEVERGDVVSFDEVLKLLEPEESPC